MLMSNINYDNVSSIPVDDDSDVQSGTELIWQRVIELADKVQRVSNLSSDTGRVSHVTSTRAVNSSYLERDPKNETSGDCDSYAP